MQLQKRRINEDEKHNNIKQITTTLYKTTERIGIRIYIYVFCYCLSVQAEERERNTLLCLWFIGVCTQWLVEIFLYTHVNIRDINAVLLCIKILLLYCVPYTAAYNIMIILLILSIFESTIFISGLQQPQMYKTKNLPTLWVNLELADSRIYQEDKLCKTNSWNIYLHRKL